MSERKRLNNLTALALFYATVASVIVFVTWDGLDIYVSKLFYLADDGGEGGGGRFALKIPLYDNVVRGFLRPLFLLLPFIITACGVLWLLFGYLKSSKASAKTGKTSKRFALQIGFWLTWLFIQYPLALIFVDGVIKPFIGRARPLHVLEFGGDKLYTSIYTLSEECVRNCSSVSSDVTFVAGFWFLAESIVSKTWRVVCRCAVLVLVFLTALGRVGYGAHFLSDVVFATLFMFIISSGLAIPWRKYRDHQSTFALGGSKT